ncbi:rust resistance kinase Lr10-like [Vitis riparia]|uniref:rust resistance kinase Lr10-like n=1 Tax=Vitis riparia TaxID=96939 RepID=UPI00155ABC99|nr:rust resistance kinase Lr10-like [Vitis riparia]
MLRQAKLVGVGLITLLHVRFLSFCAASENQPCRPSSCGDIQNISNPFRLKGDPLGCGHPDPPYELVCENNCTILYGKYHVAEINYHNYTIRVVVAGLEKSNCFSLPLYSLTIGHLDRYKYPDELDTVVLMNCARPIFDHNYIPVVPCNRTNATFSSSQPYVYALVGGSKQVRDLPYSCTIGMTVVTGNLKAVSEPSNLSSSDLQEKLLMGLQLSFLSFRCHECKVKGRWCMPNFSNNTIQCHDHDGRNWLNKLKNVLVPLIQLEVPIQPKGRKDTIERSGYSGTVGIVMIIIGGRFILGTSCLLGYLIYKFQRRHLSLDDDIEEFLQNHKNLQPIRYSYSHLKKVTDNFKNKLGQGGFGSVYKGILQSGRIVAVKVLVMSKAHGQDFINEITTIGRIHHVNIVQLVGFCVEGSKWALIYDFMPNGSLDKFIFLKGEKNIPLSWDRLYKIAFGVGHGIKYLHQGCDMQILHFDIKPHNILLDEDFTPKVSDFGLAKLYSTNESVVSLTAARGTLGYIALELFYKNIVHVSYKADVYSFGMLLMEMVGKQRHFSGYEEEYLSELFFPSWIYDRIEQTQDMGMGDVTKDEKKYIWKMVIVALWCVQMRPMDHPSMSKALDMLEGDVELLQLPPKPTLYSHEISALDRENNPIGVPISSHNASITISLDGR